MATILIGADICPIEGNLPYFIKGDAQSLFHDLLPEFEQADLVVANLECPLIERLSPILKTGPTFGEESACINGIKNAGIDVLCLANNHILDHGAVGLKNTLEVCARAGIATVGAGRNLTEARRILIREVLGCRIGILAVAEHEFSIAGEDAWGANPIDLIDFVRSVQSHRGDFDYLIVLLHGSAEFHVPTPRIQETCRFMIEMGADAVIVQHPHVLGGYEEYRGGHIVYGQGALVMDEAIYRSRKSFHEGFLVKLSLPDSPGVGQAFQPAGSPDFPVRCAWETGDGKVASTGGQECPPGSSRVHEGDGQRPGTQRRAAMSMDIIPFVQSDPVPGACRLDAAADQALRRRLEGRSAAIRDAAFVRREWVDFCKTRKHATLSALLAHNRFARKANSRGHLTQFLYTRKDLLGARNAALCETHREVIATLFDDGLV